MEEEEDEELCYRFIIRMKEEATNIRNERNNAFDRQQAHIATNKRTYKHFACATIIQILCQDKR